MFSISCGDLIILSSSTYVFDEISRFKDEVINTEDIPEDLKKHYRMTQMYLDRDDDYVRRARRKVERLSADKLTDFYGTNLRVIELCDKAIQINEYNFDAHVLKAQTLVNLEKYDDAIEEFINALSIKNDIEQHVGDNVTLKANGGRKMSLYSNCKKNR